MANREYYELWLNCKEKFQTALDEDTKIQQLAKTYTGVKPQGTVVDLVARVYCKYCDLFNKLCDIYDQMEQPQRQIAIKKVIDAITCRILELKVALEDIESFEYTYTDSSQMQMLIIPDDVQILCPHFYAFEIRQQETQYIIDQIFEGNRLGDPEPTPSELERREEARLEEERIKQEEKEAEIKRKMAMGEEILESVSSVVYTPEELEKMRQIEEYNTHIMNIQRMERARVVIFFFIQKKNKDANLYLELAGLKKPGFSEPVKHRASLIIQTFYRRFMELKREHSKEYRLRTKLGMIMPSWEPPSQKIQLEKVKAARRKFRHMYYEKWLEANVKEKSRVFRLKENTILHDITQEIKQWWRDWYDDARVFDEYPWPDEGGSILVVKGETMTTAEYFEWNKKEQIRIKQEAQSPKSKEDIKAEKLAAREEKRRLAQEAKEREKKRIIDYKKMRMNPDNDPGVYINIGEQIEPLQKAWFLYQDTWEHIDVPDPAMNVIKGHIMELITAEKAKEIQFELRPVIDEIMRLELNVLRAALKIDCTEANVKIPLTQKRKKPKKIKPPKPDKAIPAVLFQKLVDEGIVQKYPRTTLDDYWGDRNYAASVMRAIEWTPQFPPPCMGDVQEQVRLRCLLTLGCSCPNAVRSQLIVGPKGSGKRTLAYAIATETNSILINLSPMNIYNKMPGPKGLKQMLNLVNKVSRMMQPTVILVSEADRLFYSRVPKEEKEFDPTRLSKDFVKEIVKGVRKGNDKILIIGTASTPWIAKAANLRKAFPSVILIPRTDYGSISYILTKVLMKYHGIQRDFNVHSIAQALKGFDINTILKSIKSVLNGKRIASLKFKPLQPLEIVNAVLADENAVYTDAFDYDLLQQWYLAYSEFGVKYRELLAMIETQYAYKLKADANKKKRT